MGTRRARQSSLIGLAAVLVLAALPSPQVNARQCPDPYEPNDSFAQAWPLSPPASIKSYVCNANDVDYFGFYAQAGATIRVGIEDLPANYNLCLFAPSQQSISCSENKGTANEAVQELAKETGQHYALVYGHQGAYSVQAPYTLRVEIELPDLVVTDLWEEGGQICYQVRDVGQATAPQGHEAELYIGGEPIVDDKIASDLAPGERYNGCFAYAWQCSGIEKTVGVCADDDGTLPEEDEENNCREESWPCDTTPPHLLTPPTVSGVTQSSATVSWDTDENADGTVHYSSTGGLLEKAESDPTLNKTHDVVLSGLQAGTTYRYRVQAADPSGNVVTSDAYTFQTLPQPDSREPTISFFGPTGRDLPLEFAAEASDEESGVDRVAFRLDDVLIGTDYSAPFRWYLDPAYMGMSRAEFYDRHRMEAQAYDYVALWVFDRWDFDPPPPECTLGEFFFRSPRDGLTLFVPGVSVTETEIIDVVLEASETPWEYQPVPGHPEFEFEVGEPVEHVEFYIGRTLVYSSSEALTIHDYEWNAMGIGVGDHPVLARAFSHEGCVQSEEHIVRVRGLAPLLTVSREVVRDGNVFDVRVRVQNEGTEIADYAHIDRFVHEGRMAGLQCVGGSTGSFDLSCHYSVTDGASQYVITLDTPLSIPPEGAVTIGFPAVPILYPGADEYWIEEVTTEVEYHDTYGSVTSESFTHPAHEGGAFEDLVDDATAESDYLIVTNPYNLFALYNDGEVDDLLQRMAELAAHPERNGVLGYFNGYHTLQTSFNAGDQLALGGHLFRDSSDEEIVLADLGEDLIRSYGTNEELTLADERLPFAHDMSAGDVLAAGNVIDEDSAGDPHDRVEILVAHSDGSVDVYQYNYVPGSDDFTEHSFSTTFNEDDAFAVGNISGGFGTEDEAVVANDSGWIYIHSNLSSSPTGEFLSDFTAGDQFAVGDVSGNSSYDEAIVGDVSADRVRVYVYQYLGEFDEDYTITGLDLAAEDGLAVADVHGTDKEEIIIADASEDSIAVYGYDTTADDFALISEFGYPFQPEDRLAAGDVFAAGKAQIVVARGSSSGLHREGDVEILSFLVGEAPGDRAALDDLINEGRPWANRLHPTWDDDDGGYLLIVGEIEIIPTFSPSWDLFASDHGSVDYSDRDYASTRGDANRPELSIGRIIGNSAESLEKPIQAALDILSGDAEFDNSDAYCVSGRNRGASGESTDIDFTERRESIADTLRDEGFDVVEEHEPSVTSFFANDANKDFILIAGHGGRRSWDVIHRDDVDGRFSPGRARPTIYASACSTGRYPGGYGIAEAFLHRDAAAFIGSTETSISPWSARMAENFFSNVDPAHTIGSALRDAKIHRLGVNTWAWDPAYNQYHCAIHHLYGDPKLEPEWLAESAGAEVSSPIPLTEGQSSLKVTIPDYEVTAVDGGDRVEIPGGDMVIVYGEPMVPAFSVDVAVPAGTQVQDVVLSERGGLVTDTGLDIQVATPAVEGYQRAEADSEGEGWWPDHDFGWIAQEAADGSATLQIVIYPFFYHSETTNVRFYRDYTFEIETATSQVEITGWSMNRSTYAQGETVRADVYVLNSGKGPQELVAEAAVRSEVSGEIVDGLPLRTLRKVEGLASFALAWDSTGFDAGGYALELAIRDTAGTLLDSETRDVTVGRSAGEITALGAAPAVFDIGETVGVSLTFENMGTVIITGTATIIVSDGQGDPVETWDFDVPELEPGQDVTFDEKWDTAGVAHGTYMVVGHVGCGGQTAGPRAVEISSRRRVYLPLTMRAD